MTCENADIVELYWPKVDLRLRPYNITTKVNRDKFNFARASFSQEVQEHIRLATEQSVGLLRDPQPVEVYFNDKKRYHFYFRPEYVSYEGDGCSIELHDPQKHLAEFEIDEMFKRQPVKDIYELLFLHSIPEDIISGIRFDIDEDQTVTPGTVDFSKIFSDGEFGGFANGYINEPPEEVMTVDEKTVLKVLNAEYTVGFNNLSVLDGLWEMNRLVGLTSWIDEEGYLVVGSPETKGELHYAAKDDDRVWRFDSVSISHSREPIHRVVVNGPMVDASNEQRIFEYLNPLDGGGALQSKDLMAQGVAERTDIYDGKTLTVERTGMTRGTLDALAYRVLIEQIRKQNAGSVGIDPQLSSKAATNYETVSVGDLIMLVPSDDPDCGTPEVSGEVYFIDGVQHSFTGGSWSINLDVKMYPDLTAETTMRFFDPLNEQYNSEPTASRIQEPNRDVLN